MVRVKCRQCLVEIAPADVNVGEGVAYCRSCGVLSRLREMVELPEPGDVDASVPPKGCAVLDDGVTTTVRASARSAGMAVGLLAVAAFWNGIVSIFVLLALAGTINLLFGSVPGWFPAPNFNSGSGGAMGVGMVIFLWIFLLPFIAIGLGMIGALLTALAGRVEVRMRGDEGMVFIGCGPIGWRRRFATSAVRSVTLGHTTWKQNDEAKPVIVIDCGRKLRFGSTLPEERRAWMHVVLRRLLIV